MAIPMIPRQLPIVGIHQTYAKLGIDADLGTQSIKQPRATFNLKYEDPKLSIDQPQGQLWIDQDKAWDALGVGGTLTMLRRIYSQGPQMAWNAVKKIAQEGDRMAASAHTGENVIAELAKDIRVSFQQFQYAGPASYDNVDVNYEAGDLNVEVQPGRINLNTGVNPPVYDYHRGKLDIYLLQKNKVEFMPPPRLNYVV